MRRIEYSRVRERRTYTRACTPSRALTREHTSHTRKTIVARCVPHMRTHTPFQQQQPTGSYIYIYMCVCVYVLTQFSIQTHACAHTHTHTHTYAGHHSWIQEPLGWTSLLTFETKCKQQTLFLCYMKQTDILDTPT